ncbi:MAG TPA: DUF1559 domain-containing protein [Gemmataceae bacterium]|nr:DUF1559 domain-containing protein [Gemmataceae bacterium]
MKRLAILAIVGLAVPLSSARAEDLPPDLAAVPGGAIGFLHVHAADLWKNEALKDLRMVLEKAGPKYLAAFDQRFVPAPSTIDRVTIVMLNPENSGRREPPFVGIITTTKAFDAKEMIKSGLPKAVEATAGNLKYYHDEESRIAIHIINDKTFAVSMREEMDEFLSQQGKGHGPFEGALKDAGSRAPVVLALNSSLLPPGAAAELPPPVQPLARAKLVELKADFGKDLKIDARLTFADEDEAKLGEKSAKKGLGMAHEALTGLKKQMEKVVLSDKPNKSALTELPEAAVSLLAIGFINMAEDILKEVPLKRQGEVVSASVTLPPLVYSSLVSNAAVGAGLLIPAVSKVQLASGRAQSANNLKQMALAMHNYHDVYQSFPQAAICDKNGKPLLSWRVAILPFIEQDNLYKQFHLDEPWDSEHNKKLLAHMPKVYELPGVNKPGETDTYYRVFYNNGALFDLKKGVKFSQITDGTSNTIMIVEAGEAVPWTKPDDLEYNPSKPLPKLGKQNPDVFMVAMADGSVRAISKKISEKTLRAAITRDGGEVLGSDF